MSTQAPTALVVDDEPLNRRLMRALLEEDGFAVEEAEDGAAAIALIERDSYALVVSDIMMPHVDGYRLAYELRTAGNPIPIVLVTATFRDAGDRKLGLAMGADAVLEKPIDGTLLTTTIQRLVVGPRTAPAVADEKAISRYATRLSDKLGQRASNLEREQRKLALQNEKLAEVGRTLLVERGRLELILKSTADGVLEIDAQGRIAFANESAAHALGRRAADLVGRPAHDLVRGTPATPECPCAFCKAGRGERAAHVEDTFVHAEGPTFPVELSADALGGPSRSRGVVVVFRDVSERLRVQTERLQHTRDQMFRTTFDMLPIGIAIGSPDGKMLHVNGAFAAALKREPASLVGEPWGPFATQEDADAASTGAARIMREGGTLTQELAFRASDGEIVPAETGWAVIQREDGSPAYFIGYVLDLRELHAAEADRVRAMKAAAAADRLAGLGTLVAGVAHEINNPLMYIQGSIEMIRDSAQRIGEEDPAHRAVSAMMMADADTALRGLDRIGAITRGLRQVARGSNGQRLPTDLNELVSTILPVASPRIGPSIRIETRLEAGALVRCDANALSQVLLNLLVNAGDAMRKTQGTLTVTTRDEGADVVIEVADTGVGIPPDKEARIFTPFYTSKAEGTGLGLSISRAIAREHGGDLTFRSVLGKGTTFRVRVPATPKEVGA